MDDERWLESTRDPRLDLTILVLRRFTAVVVAGLSLAVIYGFIVAYLNSGAKLSRLDVLDIVLDGYVLVMALIVSVRLWTGQRLLG